MNISRWSLVGLLLLAAVIGAGGMLVSLAVNHYTSTDAFCSTSCHSMVLQAEDPVFQKSAHRTNSAGVRPTCAQCHIPTTNWFVETWVHVSSGVRDVISEMTHNFNDPKVWEAHRVELEKESLAKFRARDSNTCRSCHDASAIKPKSQAGQESHAALGAGGVTCVDCHANLVHSPATAAGQRGASLGSE
jgi:nitrate/TMAO reductase-like tetraheme cytochrome c subunit